VNQRQTVAKIPVLLLLALGARALAAEVPEVTDKAETPKPITVKADEQRRLGVQTATLAAQAAPGGVSSLARVLDPGPLIQLDSDLSAAVAGGAASRAEATRTRKLYAEDRTASTRALETADAQAQADQQKVNAAQRRLTLEWGAGVAALPGRERAALVNDLAHVRAELVRVELPPEAAVPPSGTRIPLQSAAGGEAMQGRTLGLLPVADPRLQTRGLLVELRGTQTMLAVGQMLSAQLPGSGTARGVLLPRSALLRRNARVWAYVATAPESFVRREVRDYQPVSEGWFVPGGFAPGEHIVTGGATALLGVETAASGGED
jgi:hypothetical protein